MQCGADGRDVSRLRHDRSARRAIATVRSESESSCSTHSCEQGGRADEKKSRACARGHEPIIPTRSRRDMARTAGRDSRTHQAHTEAATTQANCYRAIIIRPIASESFFPDLQSWPLPSAQSAFPPPTMASSSLTAVRTTLTTISATFAALLAHEATTQRRQTRLETPASAAAALLLVMVVLWRGRTLLVVLLLLGWRVAVLHVLGWCAVAAAAVGGKRVSMRRLRVGWSGGKGG